MQRTHAVSLHATTRQNTAVQILGMILFAGLTALGAQIEIPHQPVPYTMQTVFVLLSGALLGKRNGAMSQIVYLTAGAIGLPVFAHSGFGLVRILGPTGGYLLAFPVAAFAVGYILSNRRELLWSLVAMFVGLFIIFTLGTLQLNIVYFHSWPDAVRNGFLIFSLWDAVKLGIAALVYNRLAGRIQYPRK
ncbi:MAG: biotin transporter BioY [Ignavibacteriae bacterium]|nr:biotin transporter BioY [Ignavibacteria bacterium]MBI3364005.1 biotin transporter BioY [Ignavibacteriota bacterium]